MTDFSLDFRFEEGLSLYVERLEIQAVERLELPITRQELAEHVEEGANAFVNEFVANLKPEDASYIRHRWEMLRPGEIAKAVAAIEKLITQ